MSSVAPDKPLVLVVDDARDSRFLIRGSLSAAGFEIVEAEDGEKALDLLTELRPEVVLLDVCMPGLSGYDVCRAMKADPVLKKLPVILMSALSDRHAVAQGFAVGVVDYLTKPFRADELCARVAVHAELNRARRELESSHARLAALNAEKDQMFGMAAHDLRGPLGVIMGFAEHALRQMDSSDGRPSRQALEVIQRESEQMNHFLGTLLDLNELERGGAPLHLRDQNLNARLSEAIDRAELVVANKNITIRLVVPSDSLVVKADRSALRRIVDNLISNAVKFTPAGGSVTVRAQLKDGEAQCLVSDTGPGLTPDDMGRAFMRFARLSAKPTAGEKSTGLGLAICRALAESMGGRVWCANNPEGGATFGFSLPSVAPVVPLASRDSRPGLNGQSLSPFPHLLSNGLIR